jgi:predicted nucleic acid-binding protein
MARLVLTDASPLIGLARVDGLAWLGALFGVVWMPPEIRREVLPNRGLIGSARDLFARLHGSDFRISGQVIETVLRRVGE